MKRYTKFITSLLYLFIILNVPNNILANNNSDNYESNKHNIELENTILTWTW